ncbi:hypothetical protein V6N13_123219 [Hibiscus sabdariffa]
MRSLCFVFDVKKQGKPVWEVRTRYWKLREGENRLSVLLEGILFIHVHEWYGIGKRNEILALRGAFLNPCNDLERGIPQAFSILYMSGLEYQNRHGGIGTRFLSGICVSVLPYGYRYGSRVVSVLMHWYRSATWPGRGGYICWYQSLGYVIIGNVSEGNEETLPPPPPVGGEANEGGVGP